MSPRPRIFWSPEEFELIARAIIDRFPQCAFGEARTVEAINLSLREMLDSARAALPPERYRTVVNMAPMKIGLLAAFARLRGEKAGSTTDSHVRWDTEEWRTVAQTLQQLYPDESYFNGRMDRLKLAHINAAASTLPTGRQRHFNALTGVRERLIAAYNGRNVRDPEPAMHEPPAAQAPPAAPAPVVARSTAKVYWTKQEWLKVASELLRLDPDLQHDQGLARINANDMKQAQLVLPPERRRRGLHDMKHNRKYLLAPFQQLRELVAAGLVPPPLAATPAAAPGPQPELPPERRVTVNEWEAACKPLAQLMMHELATTLLPRLLPELVAQLRALLVPPPADTPAPAASPPPARDYPFLAPPRPASAKPALYMPAQAARPKQIEQPKKPLVGVVGPLPSQQQILRAAFPNVNFLFIDSAYSKGDVAEKLQSCDRVIGMVGFMSHPTDGALHKHFNKNRGTASPRYTRVTGGVTAIKHQIEVWLRSDVHYQSQARGQFAVSA